MRFPAPPPDENDYSRQRREKNERTHTYAAEVAKLLDGYSYTQELDGDGQLSYYTTITGSTAEFGGIEITPSLHLGTEYNTNRYVWSGNYPRDAKNEQRFPWNSTRPQITTSGEKSPAQAAKDILRRLIPPYLTLLRDVQKNVNDANAYLDKTDSNVARVAEILGVKIPDRDGTSLRFYWKGGDLYGDVQVNGDTLHVDIRSISLERGMKILRILREMNADD